MSKEEPAGELGLLAAVLRAAAREGALEGARLEDFARGLEGRAALVLEERLAPLRDRIAALERELADLRADRNRAADAHDRLLAHHRDVLGRAAAEIEAVAALPLLRRREARARLGDLARALRGEIA